MLDIECNCLVVCEICKMNVNIWNLKYLSMIVLVGRCFILIICSFVYLLFIFGLYIEMVCYVFFLGIVC